MVPDSVLEDSDVDAYARSVYATLARAIRPDTKNLVTMGIRLIAEKSNMNPHTTHKALRVLECKGHITAYQEGNGRATYALSSNRLDGPGFKKATGRLR